MKKEELIKRIIDAFTGMGSEDPEDTACSGFLTLDEAKMYLDEQRASEAAFFEPEDRIYTDDITPELYMEAYNCFVRRCRYDVTLNRLIEFIITHETVDLYHEYDGLYKSDTDKYVCPTDWLMENMEFPFTSVNLTMLELIKVGQNSPDFNPTDDYCWYDSKTMRLYSTHHPFKEGLIDARAFASWLLESPGRIWYVKDYCMLNTDIDYVFRYWG